MNIEESLSPAPTRNIRLVVGLGNPGKQYAGTRHNLGFAVLDSAAKEKNATWQNASQFRAEHAKTGGIHFLKPLSFMNLSGNPVCSFASYFKISPEEILVVLDDIALPTGALRIKKNGSGGGHNGLASIINSLKTKEIPRLRIGVGNSGHDLSSYVLGKFSPEEMPVVHESIQTASDAIFTICDKGLDVAMNKYNSRQL